jgi:ParB family transcriptional regulator, chromosome partitioning protein
VPSKRKGGFFATETRPEGEEARRSDLEALIVRKPSVPQEIGVERIEANPFQARRSFNGIDELAATIRAHGFTSRLRVRPHPTRLNYFQLVYGERQLRAARAAGLTEVPCEVASHTDDELIEIGLAENIQRRDLDPLEEARAFQMLIDERGYSIRSLAERIGKDKSYVEDRLALLRTPADVQQMVEQRPDSLRAAREIAKIETPHTRAAHRRRARRVDHHCRCAPDRARNDCPRIQVARRKPAAIYGGAPPGRRARRTHAAADPGSLE